MTHVSREEVVEIAIPRNKFGTDFIAVVHRGKVVDLLLASGRSSVHGYLWGELERVQDYVDHFEPIKEARKPTDIEVKHGNNVYVVRVEDGVPRILIPAISTEVELGDSYLSSSEREQILALALRGMLSCSEAQRTIEIALGRNAYADKGPPTTGLQKRPAHEKAIIKCVRALGTVLHCTVERCRSAAKRIIELVLGPKTAILLAKNEIEAEESPAALKTERDTPAIQAPDGISSPQHGSQPTEGGLDEWDFVPEGKQRVWCNQCEMISINGVPCHESGCPNEHKVWDPNALPLDKTSRPDHEYGEWVNGEDFAAPTDVSENPEGAEGGDKNYVIYAQKEEQRLRDPKCREEKEEVDHATSEKEAEKVVVEYKIAYGQGWRVWFENVRPDAQPIAVALDNQPTKRTVQHNGDGESTSPGHHASLFSVKANKAGRILVVDDEEAIRKIMVSILAPAGYECREAAGGLEALRLLESGEQFDLMLDDLMMPGLDGIGLLERTKDKYPDMPVVIVTGVHDVSVALASIRNGAYDYLMKPFEKEQLLNSASRALENRRLKVENRTYQTNLESLVKARTEQLQTAMGSLERAYDLTLESLGDALRLKDAGTEGHSKRVTAFTIGIARAMGLPNDQINVIARGAFMHDIGKMAIPSPILVKPDALTSDETTIMREHCLRGYEILQNLPFLAKASEIVYAHHERFDGTGYPRGLKGEQIPLGGRIVAVANTLDSITSDLPYRRAQSLSTAREEIRRESGRQFDPEIVTVFLDMPDSMWNDLRNEINKQTTPVAHP
jgi:putative nucleotidyltransferase with HDIG domain